MLPTHCLTSENSYGNAFSISFSFLLFSHHTVQQAKAEGALPNWSSLCQRRWYMVKPLLQARLLLHWRWVFHSVFFYWVPCRLSCTDHLEKMSLIKNIFQATKVCIRITLRSLIALAIMQKYGGRPHWAKVFSLRDEHFSRVPFCLHMFSSVFFYLITAVSHVA